LVRARYPTVLHLCGRHVPVHLCRRIRSRRFSFLTYRCWCQRRGRRRRGQAPRCSQGFCRGGQGKCKTRKLGKLGKLGKRRKRHDGRRCQRVSGHGKSLVPRDLLTVGVLFGMHVDRKHVHGCLPPRDTVRNGRWNLPLHPLSPSISEWCRKSRSVPPKKSVPPQ